MAETKYGYSRRDMEDIIDRGGSVLHQGQIIASKDALPTEADLAQGDPAAEAQTKEQIDAQMATLQRQRDQLDAAAKEREQAERRAALEGPDSGQGGEATDTEARRAADAKKAEK